MFGLGTGELVIIAVIVLLVVGPNKLPTFMKTIGKTMRELRRASNELKRQAGLDELMREPIHREVVKPAPVRRESTNIQRGLSEEERNAESPDIGVDADFHEQDSPPEDPLRFAKHKISGADTSDTAKTTEEEHAEGQESEPERAAT